MSMCISTAHTGMDVSWNGGTLKSFILIGTSTINHPFWGISIYGNPEILPRNLSYRVFVQRSCQETSYGDLVQRSCQETSDRDLSNRAPLEILYRDLVKRAAVLLRDLWLRAWTEISQWDPWQRSSVEISYRHLVQIALHRDLAQQLLQRTCQGVCAGSTEVFTQGTCRIWPRISSCPASLQPVMILGPFHLSF